MMLTVMIFVVCAGYPCTRLDAEAGSATSEAWLLPGGRGPVVSITSLLCLPFGAEWELVVLWTLAVLELKCPLWQYRKDMNSL